MRHVRDFSPEERAAYDERCRLANRKAEWNAMPAAEKRAWKKKKALEQMAKDKAAWLAKHP